MWYYRLRVRLIFGAVQEIDRYDALLCSSNLYCEATLAERYHGGWVIPCVKQTSTKSYDIIQAIISC